MELWQTRLRYDLKNSSSQTGADARREFTGRWKKGLGANGKWELGTLLEDDEQQNQTDKPGTR